MNVFEAIKDNISARQAAELYGTPEEKKALVDEQRKEVMKLEQRIAGYTAGHDRGRSQRKSGLDR